MNCQEFESNLSELARGQMMDARVREDAAAHRETCAPCASRLTAEQALTNGLRVVAAACAMDEGAPPRVEAMLRAAFRQQVQPAHAPAPASNGSNVVPLARPMRQARFSIWTGAAVAASVMFVVFAGALALRMQNAAPAGSQASSRALKDEAPRSTPQSDFSAPTQDHAQELASAENTSDSKEMLPVAAPRSRRVGTASGRSNPGSGLMRPASTNGSAQAASQEITTEFIPLMQADGISAADGGQVVRVEMPRSALASMGLPMNMERADERVKADIVLGHDGVARAIRFVR